jgi:uncharacterized protein
LLPKALLLASAHLEGERIVPHYFKLRDEAWLAALLGEYRRFVGRKCSELQERLREPLPTRAPKTKLRVAIIVLDALSRARPTAAVPPKEARATLFRAAVGGRASRGSVLSSVAASLAVTLAELESALFADLQSEARVAELPISVTPSRLVTDANLEIASSLIRRAAHVRIVVSGSSRALVRHARHAGLICTLSRPERSVPVEEASQEEASQEEACQASDGLTLEVSGPLSLFQHTALYGRALASLIPSLVSCREFELTARCALNRGSRLFSFTLCTGDPIGAGRQTMHHERPVQSRFERDFGRLASNWTLTREPHPLVSGTTLIFPEFELIHRHDESRRWLLEIVGFWTHQYLCEKLANLRAAGIDRLLLCIDRGRPCAEGALPQDCRIIRYQTRIDPRAVLAIIEG